MNWDVSPIIFELGPIQLRWYGVLFGLNFLIGAHFMDKMYLAEGKRREDVSALFMYIIVGVIAGARLGHCLFYEPGVYLADPLRILKIWEGGLASHGAVIGTIAGTWLYQRKKTDQDWFYVMDRLAISMLFGGMLIRLGNLFNSEIIGKPTDLPWAVIFKRVDALPRHPSQVYEALVYLGAFFVLRAMYQKQTPNIPRGQLFGVGLIIAFVGRFLIEFTKENQVAFEYGMALNMGQLLSIPVVGFAAWLVWRSRKVISTG